MADDSKYPSVPEERLRGVVRTSLDNPSPTAAQLARRERSLAVLQSLGVPFLASLPVTEEESAIEPRTAEEIAQRCIATAICAVKGETDDHELGQNLLDEYGARSFLSPAERAYMSDPSPSQQDRTNFAWRYECVHVFLWSLGHLESLHPPNEICDVPGEMMTIREMGLKGLVSFAKLQTPAGILEQVDLYYHLHWSAIELRLRGETSDELDASIILERHRALNWLIRYMGQEWDDVTTDT